jgi:hypothetical protein
MYQSDEHQPPAPRMGGRTSAILGLALFGLALLVFTIVLGIMKIIPLPFMAQDEAGPAPLYMTPSPMPSSARFSQPGDCVTNRGTEADPEMVLAPCAPGVLQVLQRFDATSDVTVCGSVPDYRFHYFYDSELAGLDFVLCMRKRP